MVRSARWLAPVLVVLLPLVAGGASLDGSKASLRKQQTTAENHKFTHLKNYPHLKRFVDAGLLVRLDGNANYELYEVAYPYARPEVEMFINRLSAQYKANCGEKLVVTSLTRPQSSQPWNASQMSVHPTGMAVDLRRSTRRTCRGWIERVLLSLEGEGVVEATRERQPPHYHVAVFPREYTAYVNRMIRGGGERTWMVRNGDTLWQISRETGASVTRIREINGLRGNTIREGQVLALPTR